MILMIKCFISYLRCFPFKTVYSERLTLVQIYLKNSLKLVVLGKLFVCWHMSIQCRLFRYYHLVTSFNSSWIVTSIRFVLFNTDVLASSCEKLTYQMLIYLFPFTNFINLVSLSQSFFLPQMTWLYELPYEISNILWRSDLVTGSLNHENQR